MTRSNILPVASSLHDAGVVSGITASLRPALDAAGATLIADVADAAPDVPFALLVLTGGTERSILAACSARHDAVPGEPVVLVTHGEQNSLPAALEALARLQLDGCRGRIVEIGGGVASATAMIDAILDVGVWHALHRARVGVLGEPSDWLVASVPDAAAVRSRWGTSIVDVELAPVMGRYAVARDAPMAVPVRLGARHVHEPTPSDVDAASRFEPVLRRVVADEHLDAVAVRCFDLVIDAHTSGCLALSALNDDGVIAGCEGDIASTIGLLWVKLLTGRLGWMANPAAAHADTGVVELAHCTVPRSLVSGYDLRSHFESGLGVGIAGELPPGPVTLVRLGGRELERLWCVEGDALTTSPREGRCRTQLDVRLAPSEVAELLAHPLGNHLIVVAGHVGTVLRSWWEMAIA